MRRSRSRQPAQRVRAEAMRTPRQRFREVSDRKGWGMLNPRCIYIIARRTRGRKQYQMLPGGNANRLDGNHVLANSKQFLGLEDPANRLPPAVQRTAPLALVLYSLIVVWFHRLGQAWL